LQQSVFFVVLTKRNTMNPEQIIEFNKRCAEFLGYVNTTPTDKDFNIYEKKGGEVGNLIEPMSMKFHSDWNWIMEVVEAIEKILTPNNFCTMFEVEMSTDSCEIKMHTQVAMAFEEISDSFDDIETRENTRKEAVVSAINQFLIWYSEYNKK